MVPPSPSPRCLLRGEDSDGEFSSLFFSLFKHFSPHFFQLNCYLVGCAATLPQSLKGTRSHHHHPCTPCCMEKMVTVSVPLFYFFHFKFSQIFYRKIVISRPRRPPSLSLSREQGPTITILLPPVAWRRW